jgi:hypothetical protein
MKRLALLLAAAVLGTGCYTTNTCDTRDLTLTWSGFDGPAAGVNQACGAVGITSVDVFLDGQPVTTVPCTDYGVIIANVRSGAQLLTVEGIDGSGAIRFRDEASINPSGCGNFSLGVRPAAGTVNLNYGFQSGSTCASASSFMWFSVLDTIANQTAAVVDSLSPLADKRSFACGPDVLISLPQGSYQLDFMQEVVESPSLVFTEAARACVKPGFNVASRTETNTPITLVDTGVACL